VYTKALSESDHWLQKVKGNKIPSWIVYSFDIYEKRDFGDSPVM
jgi:hypothetical protein